MASQISFQATFCIYLFSLFKRSVWSLSVLLSFPLVCLCWYMWRECAVIGLQSTYYSGGESLLTLIIYSSNAVRGKPRCTIFRYISKFTHTHTNRISIIYSEKRAFSVSQWLMVDRWYMCFVYITCVVDVAVCGSDFVSSTLQLHIIKLYQFIFHFLKKGT